MKLGQLIRANRLASLYCIVWILFAGIFFLEEFVQTTGALLFFLLLILGGSTVLISIPALLLSAIRAFRSFRQRRPTGGFAHLALAVFAGGTLWYMLQTVGCGVSTVIVAAREVRKIESAMQSPGVYMPVGRQMALYCQSDPSFFSDYMEYPWLPAELNALRHGWLCVRTNQATVEMGGGFHHFGYQLDLDPGQSTRETNVWQLSAYSEDAESKHLQTIMLPVGTRMEPEALLEKAVAGYDEQLRKNRGDEEAHQGKIQVCLRFDKVAAARKACADMLEAMPEDWWAVLVNALLAEEQSPGRGMELMTGWAKKNENFFRYIDLAYFCHLTQRPREAARAIVKATEFDAATEWGDGGNSEHRGYTAAMCAYRAGDYAAAIKLCDHLLPIKINGDYAKVGLRALKEASQKAMEGQVTDVPWASGILPFDAFEKVDIAKLLGRPVPRPMADR